jgi:hypothetical protein
MGKPVWMLVAQTQDWRWMENTNTTPWYPTMRLFRQKVRSQWGETFDEINEELKKFKPLR